MGLLGSEFSRAALLKTKAIDKGSSAECKGSPLTPHVCPCGCEEGVS